MENKPCIMKENDTIQNKKFYVYIWLSGSQIKLKTDLKERKKNNLIWRIRNKNDRNRDTF